jgi:protoheme IX farnesyltransferase
MVRTRGRPLPMREIGFMEALGFAVAFATCGLGLLYSMVNPLTIWLTFAPLVGYVVLGMCATKPEVIIPDLIAFIEG